MTRRDSTSVVLQRVSEDARRLVLHLQRLIEIGTALSAERDLDALLERILTESRALTGADAGSIWLRQDRRTPTPNPTGADPLYTETPFLVLKHVQNDSITFPFREARIPLNDTSVAGYAAATGQTIRVADSYHLPPETPYRVSTTFDEATGYSSRSMLVVPMRNREGHTLGVLQLINKKVNAAARLRHPGDADQLVLPFDDVDEELIVSLASQAAVAVENAYLYGEVMRLFDGFVASLAHVLEGRSEHTHGHCQRVARYAEAIARAISESTDPPFQDIRFTEEQIRQLRYAALLHDIGKLVVPEAILDKRNKLTDAEMQVIALRFRLAGRPAEEVEFLRRIHIPRPMSDEDEARLRELAALTFEGAPLLTPHELENLAVRHGNLTAAERREIETHIVHTWEILRRIDWPRSLERVPHIAATHHEKLDGSGYPWGLKAAQLDVLQRILPIVDIFEALTARDRPYKPPVPVPEALKILEADVRAGKLDAAIVRLLVARNIHRMFSDETGVVRTKEVHL